MSQYKILCMLTYSSIFAIVASILRWSQYKILCMLTYRHLMEAVHLHTLVSVQDFVYAHL